MSTIKDVMNALKDANSQLAIANDRIRTKCRANDMLGHHLNTANSEITKLKKEVERLEKLKGDFGPFYFKDLNLQLKLPSNSWLDTQMKVIKDLQAQLDTANMKAKEWENHYRRLNESSKTEINSANRRIEKYNKLLTSMPLKVISMRLKEIGYHKAATDMLALRALKREEV